MAEFKIGRLRFTWAGEWTTGTFYNRDAVAQFNGKTYVCLVPHNSSTFYADLARVSPSGAQTPYWSLMLDGNAWKSGWEPTTEYALGNIVTYGGIVYICSTQHTSGASQIDLSKWTTYAQFDKWNNAWTTATVYGLGDLVKYGGIVYRCTTNHLSGTYLEDDQSKWAVVNDGIEYKGPYAATTRYKVNDLVKLSADLYICTVAHNSVTLFDVTKWELWLPGQTNAGTWNNISTYQPGDTVIYGGYSYTGQTLNNLGNIPSQSSANWTLLTTGYKLMNEWSGGTSYKPGDVVRRNGQLFVSLTDNASQDPTGYIFTGKYIAAGSSGTTVITNKLSGIIPGMLVNNPGFLTGQRVVSASFGSSVSPTVSPATRTTTATGTNATPELTVTSATGIVPGMLVTGVGIPNNTTVLTVVSTTITISNNLSQNITTSAVIFGANSVVVSDATGVSVGMVIKGTNIVLDSYITSISSTTLILSTTNTGVVGGTVTIGTPTVIIDHAPDVTLIDQSDIEFIGPNGTYWNYIANGIAWKKFWTLNTNYVLGDLVVWQNGTYKCVQNHSANAFFRPDLDVEAQFWTPYLYHASKNALNTQGDIVTYKDGKAIALPIGEHGQTLEVIGGQPSWQDILVSPGVYYVASTGTDALENGKTWEQPWRTIRYACEQVKSGTQNPNTAFLLNSNKNWMVTEMYYWMLYQKSQSNAPFSPSSSFDKDKTFRDAEFIIDGIIYDITRGGNSQTVYNTKAYFADGYTNQFVNAGTAASMPFFIAALNQLLSLMFNAINKTVPSLQVTVGSTTTIYTGSIYQTLNSVPAASFISQVNSGPGAEGGVTPKVTVLFDIVITALTNQNTAKVPASNQGLTATIFVKTGTYSETLPIVVPENVAIVGDELRGTVVQPKVRINTVVKSSSQPGNYFTAYTTNEMVDGTPLQFAGTNTFGGPVAGVTCYVADTNAEANEGTAEEESILYYNNSLTHANGHSKIIGWALDGYPIYGPYGYDIPNSATSGARRLLSGYTTKVTGYRTGLAANLANYPMGIFVEDYQFTNAGDLDISNGRYCVTPDYPNGTYAYFVTVNADSEPVFPYVIGTQFYGTPATFGTDDYVAGNGTAPLTYGLNQLTDSSNFDGAQHRWTLRNGQIRIRATGLPYHNFGTNTSTTYPFIQNYDQTWKLRGGTNLASGSTQSVGSGPIGWWLNGVAIFGPSAQGSTPNGYTAVAGYTFNFSSQAAINLNYSVGADLAGGITSNTNYYNYRDFNFADAWSTGTGSSLVGTALTGTTFSICAFPGGPIIPVKTASTPLGGDPVNLYGGDALQDMFRLRNGTGLRNMTFTGLLGTLTAQNVYQTQRPTGGSYGCLDPGQGPGDTSAWIFARSPYAQNVTMFGQGVTGLKIDSRLHNGGNKSIVCNDYTTILSDGIGVWTVGGAALCEAVSVFSYFGYAGYFAEQGGRIRATNGNSSYGTYGVIAEGYDITETPIYGTVFNRNEQAKAEVQSAFGINANLLKLQYSNAGSQYTTQTTNLLKQSNNFQTTWQTDGNIGFQKNTFSPTGNPDGWTITGNTSGSDGSYFYQNVTILPTGATYSDVSGSNISGSGTSAVFNITVNATGYSASVGSQGGSGYVLGNEIRIYGSQLGGIDGTNDLILTVASLSGSTVLTVTVAGTVPTGSALNYTLSIHVKKGTSASVDLYAFYSGTSTLASAINYNFDTKVITPSSQDGGGLLPPAYGSTALSNGWYRVWFTVYDLNALNNTLQFRIYPRTRLGSSGYTLFYGSQVEIGSTPNFYLSTTTQRYTAYADFIVTGAGSGAVLVGDEVRSGSVFQTRVTDTGAGAGGAGYLTASNNAQGGTDSYVTLAASDINTPSALTGMRVFINSGTGAGQYGYIANYNLSNKRAFILKESFTPVGITQAISVSNSLTLDASASIDTLYLNMPVQFIPTYYNTTVNTTSIDGLAVNNTVGGTTNTIAVSSTARLYRNQPVTFSGAVFGGVIGNYTYYISAIIDGTTCQISTEIFGTTALLNTATGTMSLNIPSGTSYMAGATGSMLANMPIQFTGTSLGGVTTGTIYYVNDIIDPSNFTISSALNTVTVTAADNATKTLTVASTGTLEPLNPIIFSGVAIGGVTLAIKYYISKIVDSQRFQLTDTISTQDAVQTFSATSLIKVTSTTGFVVNNPIRFAGISLGNLVSDQVYYILAINDSTTFTVSQTVGGSAFPVASAQGRMVARTAGAARAIIVGTGGTMTGTTTNAKTTLTTGAGVMNAIFSTPIFGGVEAGTTYWIKTINPGATNTITLTTTSSGSNTLAIVDNSGSMQLALVGWDHVNSGTIPAPSLDSTSAYFVEPKMIYSTPPFTQITSTTSVLAISNSWIGIEYGKGLWMAIPDGNATISTTTDGSTWTSITLPTVGSWTDIAYGNNFWVIISSGGGLTETGSRVLYSASQGQSWRSSALPSKTTWSAIAYGDGNFVAIANGTNSAAYSTNFGGTWTTATLPGSNLSWTGVAYGSGIFVAVATGTGTAARSTNGGATWSSISLPVSTAWSDVDYGNGRFVAVSSSSNITAYSFDGVTWYSSNISISATKIKYGQGIFVAINTLSSTGYTSEDGLDWTTRTVAGDAYGGIAFGFDGSSKIGKWITVSGQSTGSTIRAGAKAKGRPIINSGKINSIVEWETGSNYPSVGPTLTFFDPNVTSLVTTANRVENGVLSAPSFVNRGTGYNTTSTAITINGSGYADDFQTGLFLNLNNLTKLPSPGDNMTISGNAVTIYKITNATPLYGTVAPNITATVQLSPEMTVALSPTHSSTISIRQKYSQVRLTNHDYLNIGYGNRYESNYPGFPIGTELSPQNEAVEVNYGRVFYTSTDQDGNFKVGSLFGVQQATGIVTLSASQFGLSGLDKITLGGISVGGSSVIINQFSIDPTFVANSNNIVPTQKAIKTYLASRLSQGGSNTFTGQTTAGQVVIGGPDKIYNTIPNGTAGSSIKMLNRVNIASLGEFGGVDGDMMAFNFFMLNSSRKSK
jgi:hypothetical protein